MPGQIRIPKQRGSAENRAEKASLETRPYRATPAQSEQNRTQEDVEAQVAPTTITDESELDQDVLSELDDLDAELEANAQFMGQVAVSIKRDETSRAWEAWRQACIGETAILAA